ncbi:ABC transporter permease [Sinorhizobium meliloti]|uniref:ABC transporter permease n=1 Tax=Rhizobium meliloti TaxID=382 RepID=UPI0003DCADC0|nr:ABC transporter permease [Sinorhizobium meliloti]ARS71023.1 ABC transporter permease [Sinorhizobium meliloti RU11/001]
MSRIVLAVLYWVFFALIILFIALPLLVVVAAAFSPTIHVTFEFWTWTFDWIWKLWSPTWIAPFLLSAKLAALVAIITGVLASLGAYAVAYRKVPGHDAIMSFLLSPLAVPQIVKGVAIVLFFSSAGLYRYLGFPGLVLGHVILTIPFAVRMIATAIYNFDKNLDRAAQVLGANKWQRIYYVLLPLIKPGIFSGMTFAFIISFNDVPISLFLARPGEVPLPIKVIEYFHYGLDPVLAAVNVASLLFLLAVIFLFERIGGFSAQIHGGSK